MPSETSPPASGDRAVAGTRSVDIVVSLLLLAFAAAMAWDNWRTGVRWASDGPEAGYFPFYLALMLGGASLVGLWRALRDQEGGGGAFVTRDQLRRVSQVLLPSLAFVLLTQVLGLYVASFLLVAGFMWRVGRISPAISLLTAFLFSAAMFATFEVAFNVIMPKGPLEAAFGY